ncbi:MAG: MATE family efflux transporter [Thermoanaerobaculales bacterium]|jgi:putative MATE family efflux protein|nr:MATE family efflux transporter [Thermoanaerobaculales bacterium]
MMTVDPERRRRILALALPIVGGMVSQNVLNLVDTAMVGVLGAAALAAVGMASFANFMASAFITGLSAGVQAMAARRLGEGRSADAAVPLNGGLLLAVVLALPLSVTLIAFTDEIFALLVDDPEVAALGAPYLGARLAAMAALGVNFAFRGYWNGVSMSKVYMRTLVVMHASNIALNWVLIFGHLGLPALGVAGAGIGSAIATFIGSVLYVVQGWRLARGNGFLRRLPDRRSLATMLRLSVPTGFQQFFFAAGLTAFFWIIGRVGTAELAASNVLVQLLLVAILPGLGSGMAAASLVGQALGRGDATDAKRWGWEVARLATVTVGLLALLGLVLPDLLLRPFLHDEATLALARLPLRILAATMSLDTLGMVLMNALLGAGDNLRVMAVALVLQWVVFLPSAYLVGPVLGLGITGIWVAHVGYRVLQAAIFAGMWRRGDWTRIEV